MLHKLVSGCTAWALPARPDTCVFGSWPASGQLAYSMGSCHALLKKGGRGSCALFVRFRSGPLATQTF